MDILTSLNFTTCGVLPVAEWETLVKTAILPPHRVQREVLTSTDSDRFDELLPPAVCPHHEGQVRLLNEFVHSALERGKGIRQ